MEKLNETAYVQFYTKAIALSSCCWPECQVRSLWGALSSDFGPILLRGIDQQTGLTQHLAWFLMTSVMPDTQHKLCDLFAQRIFQVPCAYEGGNDANSLRHDPMFKRGFDKKPLDEDNELASATTFSRFENASSRKDIYRLSQAFVDLFIASYTKPPKVIVLDVSFRGCHLWPTGDELL